MFMGWLIVINIVCNDIIIGKTNPFIQIEENVHTKKEKIEHKDSKTPRGKLNYLIFST